MKVLIISYYWPPAGGPGFQIWLNFVKYLTVFDIDPIVFIPENPSYPIIDEYVTSEVAPKITVLKHKIFEPYQFASVLSNKKTKAISSGLIKEEKQSFMERLLLYIRGNFFIPDARKFWVKPSVKFLQEYLSKNSIDIIISTGPPHSLHLIGLQLKQQLDIRWIADFRDPWTTIGYHDRLKLSSKSKKKHRKLESQVLNQADDILVTSPSTKKEFELLTQKPITVITNGFDDLTLTKTQLDKKFSCSHIGSLLAKRNPIVLWEVFAEIIQENPSFKEDFELNLIGKVSAEIVASIEKAGLKEHLNLFGYVSHEEARDYQMTSQVLLLIEIDAAYAQCIIPGKLYEYMQSGRPIIGLGPEKADFKQIINETNTGFTFNYNEKERLKKTVFNLYQSYKENNLNSSSIGIQQYHRKSLTEKLAELLKK
ncbi:MAG: glycosyltransferase [Flavobacteriaceae bacterium]|nr:glycosyltransferase [Flavobacteriaceae bacterium]